MEREKSLKPRGDTVAFFQMLAGFAIAILVMLGVGGTFYQAVSSAGWLSQMFGRHVAGGLAAMVALLTLSAALWRARGLISARSRNRYSELFVYTVAAAGGMYVLQMATRGL